eukprot:COSAG05_NODE_25762_length_193_cov_202.978723_1_plen_50_part_01
MPPSSISNLCRVEHPKKRRQWRTYVEELVGNGKFDTEKANTPAETAAAID